MTSTEIREGLVAIRDSVAVPPVDHAELQARTRRLRRRRSAVRAVGAAGVVALVVAAAVVVSHRLGGARQPDITVTDPGAPGVPVVVAGRVELLQPDGSLTDTGLSGTPIGWLGGRQVVLGGERLTGVGDVVVDGVRAAYAGSFGVAYQLTDGDVHWVGAGARPAVPEPGTLLAAGDHGYVVGTPTQVVIHDARGPHPVELGSDGAVVEPDRAEIGGHTVVVVADGSEQFFDTDGTRRFSLLGGETGALSPDGTTYAYAANERELAQGMRQGLVFSDTTTGAGPRVPLSGASLDLAWYDGHLYVLTQQATGRTLWECDPQACEPRFTTDDDTVALR